MPLKRIGVKYCLLTILGMVTLVSNPQLIYAAPEWEYNPDPPSCSIIFSGSGTITATIEADPSSKITAISQTENGVTTNITDSVPALPATSTTYTWTPISNSTFIATVSSNSTGNSNTCTSVYTPIPPQPTNLTASCSRTRVDLSWSAVSSATTYNYTVGSESVNNIPQPLGMDPMLVSYSPTIPGNSYNWSVTACNNAGCSNPKDGTLFACSNAIRPWIQVTGDVHSNTRIRAPGGP